MTPRPTHLLLATLALALARVPALFASGEPLLLTDTAGDAAIRRTDPGLDGPLPTGTPPDLLSIRLSGWLPTQPTVDPWTGQDVSGENADLFRLDVAFAGRINPPGPVGLGGQPFDPLRFGDSPVFGFIEFDVDHDARTGGECSGAAIRYTANAARFGSRPPAPYAANCATRSQHVDGSFASEPRIERTGAEFTLALCGCHQVTLVSESLTPDAIFEPGETWIVRSRFFQRCGGFEDASAAFGGSFFGLYDPWVDLRFRHDIATDRTTVSLVFPLTMQGAALLTGEPLQPADLDVSNHVSVQEALEDIIAGAAFPPPGCGGALVAEWDDDNVYDHLDPTEWDVIPLVGIAYTTPEAALYAWTDFGFGDLPGDFNGDGTVDSLDVDEFDAELAALDGTATDADGTTNGIYLLANPGPDFSLYDVNNDGQVDAADRPAVTPVIPGDVDGDCHVDFTDLNILLAHWAMTPADLEDGDLNDDNHVDFADLNLLLANWGTTCP
ncbi:MAG: hypothetical protein KDA21_05860 [Phycisphaerales bacterium]|nr:hypothetical protein [Phycisphaerales bacterium]